MSSKPIIYWVTQAPREELFAKVDELIADIGDKKQMGYVVAADIATSMWPSVRSENRPLYAVGVLFVMLTAHCRFYHECAESLEQPEPEFLAFMNYLRTRLNDLMSAVSNRPSAVIYDLVFFLTQRRDPQGIEQRIAGVLKPVRDHPIAKY